MRFIGAAAIFLVAAVTVPFNAAQFRVTADFRLPAEAQYAQDVRWSDDDQIIVAAARRGVMRFRVGAALVPIGTAVPPEHARGGFFFSSRLAWSQQYLVTGSSFGLVGWKRSGSASGIQGSLPFATTIDLDARGDSLLILGANRDDKGVWAPEGAIAWLGSLASGMTDIRPILLTHVAAAADGTKAQHVSDCFVMENGAVRFLADGSFIIVPGVEPGAYLYAANGKLVRTWQTASLGIQDRCELSREEAALYQRSVPARDEWLNRRTIVDDILPLGNDAGLVIRTVVGGRATWKLLVLARDGSTSSAELPVKGTSSLSHIRGDVRGGKAVFLVQEHGSDAPRIIIATVNHTK